MHSHPCVMCATACGRVVAGDHPLQLVAARDVGFAAARVFQNPEPFVGRWIPLAGDQLTPVQMCEAYSRAQGGVPVKHSHPPAWLFWFLSRYSAGVVAAATCVGVTCVSVITQSASRIQCCAGSAKTEVAQTGGVPYFCFVCSTARPCCARRVTLPLGAAHPCTVWWMN